MKKILICKTVGLDSSGISEIIARHYELENASSVGEAKALIKNYEPDVIIFGESFCGNTPAELSKEAKELCNARTLIFLAEGHTEPYNTFENGGDDVIFTPFDDIELLTRLNALCRNTEKSDTTLFKTGQMTIDYENCRVYISDKLLHLTMLEYKLLCLLSKSCGSAVSYQTIMRELWQTPIGNEIQSLRVFVNAIRKKIRQLGDSTDYIRTQMGIGYIIPIID